MHAHLANLERAGYLKRDPTKPRALELTGLRRQEPAPGRARAARNGCRCSARSPPVAPLLAEDDVEEYIAFPSSSSAGRRDFLLRVKGDSMVNAGILDGDYVVVRKAETAKNGEIVVALAGDDESADEATVKRYFREDGRMRLQPENDALEPIYANHVQLLGKVGGSSGRYERHVDQPDTRAGALRAAARREPRVPRLRRVRPAPPRCDRCPECGATIPREQAGSASGLQSDARAG